MRAVRHALCLGGALLGAGLAAYALSALLAFSRPTEPWFCGSCHQMQPLVQAWQHSPHAKVACTSCHSRPGLIGALAGNLGAAREVVTTLTGAWRRMRPMRAQVSDDACIACHRRPIRNRQGRVAVPGWRQRIVYRGRRVSMHGLYRQGFKCTQCHSTVAEGNLVPPASRTYPHLPPGAAAWLEGTP
ncbi:MAG: NapC/NirT family cytochrome c [Thermaerobacter sp.]|nr:NapC/NirT family cytochrome c [Thermaerobacter sp.]